MAGFDWDHLRTFLAVARTGRLTAAAAQMGSDHATISRRIGALEGALRTKLFERSPTGYALTEDGSRLLEIAGEIESLASQAIGSVGGGARAIEGTVRIASPEGFGTYFLASRLPRLAERYPRLNVQLIAATGIYSLSKREADMAITLSRPPRGRVIAKKLIDYDLGLYAARSYLERNAEIRNRSDLEKFRFVGYIGDLIQIPELDYLHYAGDGVDTSFSSNNLVAQLKATIAGAGLCILPSFIGRFEPELLPILPDEIHLTRSYWIVIHEDQRERANIKVLLNFIYEQVLAARDQFRWRETV